MKKHQLFILIYCELEARKCVVNEFEPKLLIIANLVEKIFNLGTVRK